MELHQATIWEAVADAVGSHDAVVHGDRRLSWTAFEARSARLAGALLELGLSRDAKVAVCLFNCPELLEARFAALKIRAVPVNVNYRYRAEELWYVLDNSDSEAVVFHSSLAAELVPIRSRLPRVRAWIQVNDGGDGLPGALDYEALVEACAPARRIRRAPEDIHLVYTGGTTGKPKGVMWEVGKSVLGGLSIGSHIGLPQTTVERLLDTVRGLAGQGSLPRSLVACPLMHGTGIQMGANPYLLFGGCVLLPDGRKFDPHAVWRMIEAEAATVMTLVGDAIARPLLSVLEQGHRFGLETLHFISSSGVMFSAETKAGLVRHLPWLSIWDLLSSSEGRLGHSRYDRHQAVATSTFVIHADARVFDERDEEIAPGSGKAGALGVKGNIPLGYYKDPEKTARTFRVIRGERWSFPGDHGIVHADGTLTLLGRGSAVINSGGEKIYAEEVEEAVKRHPDVADCLVVGVPDERWGQCVAALVSARRPVHERALVEFVRKELAAYKIPRRVTFVDQVPRTASGKPDYPAARAILGQAVACPTAGD
jgi:acyl-CoA synthetase (AMP-forming)/AMP-acid ligase II